MSTAADRTAVESATAANGAHPAPGPGAPGAAPAPDVSELSEDAARSSAAFLGYFSVGLGLAELLIPRAVQRFVGVAEPRGGTAALTQAFGARELGAGIAILTSRDPAPAVWARVAGDALDIAALGVTLANGRNGRARTLFALGNVLAITALDVLTARRLS
jgi:hypothetical protein